ncbi:MAG: hypothetical protein MN733_01545, partial [Nitrososphaera sp.]|nr:hypothetical protein [Nitrososphaera sp.]
VLHVSFENFGDEIINITSLDRDKLSRTSRKVDLGTQGLFHLSTEQPAYIKKLYAIPPLSVGTDAPFTFSNYSSQTNNTIRL